MMPRYVTMSHRRTGVSQPEKPGSSPYSTGGGGVKLEHEFVASALTSLLLGQPIEGLGNEFTVSQVALQQGVHSAVDDVAIQGTAPGGERTLRVACRRHPVIGRSDPSTISLFADFMDVVTSESSALASGRLRLGLAVSGPFGPASELAVLTDVARRQPDHSGFEHAISASGAYSNRMRERLRNVAELVEAALISINRNPDDKDCRRGLIWQLLKALFVVELQLEGDVAPGKTSLVARLNTLTADVSRAEDLRLRLLDIASEAAIRAGVFTRSMLRAELRSFGLLDAAPDFAHARSQIELLESELRGRTPRSVPVPGTSTTFSVDRSDLQRQLVKCISTVSGSGVVLVRGEPDVGKSAITLAAVDSIRASGGVVLAASLRDLPSAAANLKGIFGMATQDLLAAAPSAPVNVLVLDGAEVVQERDSDAAGALISAAKSVGMTTVLVVRDDAVDSVVNLVRAYGSDKPVEFVVGPLSAGEIASLIVGIPRLARLASDSRAGWLMRRIGLVELVLKAEQRGSPLPEALSSEAELFAAVWSSLVRQDERTIKSVSPDDREAALIDLAREILTGVPIAIGGGPALASLRSDGVLACRGPLTAWDSGDRFASDVLRDFAAARLFLRHGIQVLQASTAPRWAIRATRLFAQARLAQAISSTTGPFQKQWTQLRGQFSELSAVHGPRWAELPWEALLTATWADRVLAERSAALVAEPEMLSELLRTMKLRFSHDGTSDVPIGAPLISWLVDTGTFDHESAHGERPIADLVMRWLRGVARLEASGEDISTYRALRVRVRDVLIRSRDEHPDSERLESLGLLGGDSTDEVVSALRAVAPGFLAPLVESFDVAASMSRNDSKLLAELAEQYYVERPSNHPWQGFMRDEGVRGHGAGGFGAPLAAWYRGPFLFLLRRDFRRGLQLIDRMLDHGARARVETLRHLNRQLRNDAEQQFECLEFDLFGGGSRRFVGDPHVWGWYRGSSVGPYPCMSALFSLEMFLDECVKGSLEPKALVKRVMQDASTLATLGLCFGFFVRHIDKVSDELDEFLVRPQIWDLEFGRVSSEGHLHVQGIDDPSVVGRERRGWTPLQVAMHLVVSAAQAGDKRRLEQLCEVGRRLVEAAGGKDASPTVVRCAAHLDWNNYSIVAEGKQQLITVNVPEDVIKALAPVVEDIDRREQMYRLLNRYRPKRLTPYRFALAILPSDEEITSDFHCALDLEQALQGDLSGALPGALAGVAAAVLHRTALGATSAKLPDECFAWALRRLVHSATTSDLGASYISESIFPDGADRQAALALPLVLLVREDESPPTPSSQEADAHVREFLVLLCSALEACTCSPFLEVRHNIAEGVGLVFEQPCEQIGLGPCWHEPVWQAIEAGARNVVLGKLSEDGRREIEATTDIVSLAQARDQDLMLTHIAPAAICALDAARGRSCIAARAQQLRDILLDAYARSARHWAENNYHRRDEQDAAFASAVLRWAAEDNAVVLVDIGTKMRESPAALSHYLGALIMVATYETTFVPILAKVWPQLMELGLASLREFGAEARRYTTARLLDRLIPSPSAPGYFDDPAIVLAKARQSWFPIASISGHVEEWLKQAQRHAEGIDALAGFLRTLPAGEQVKPGLDWIRDLVVDDDGTASTCGFLLVSWLRSLRDSSLDDSASRSFRAVVDALVLGNFKGARDLQRLDE